MSYESIEHLLFREEPAEVRRFPMYRSKFTKQVREEMKRVKDCHRTFGLPKELLTMGPLKKGSRKIIRPNVDKARPEGLGRRLSPVPKREDWVRPLQKEQPYFPLKNALAVVRSAPPAAARRTFDTASGRRVPEHRLLQPCFVLNEEFGKVPKYLEKRKALAAEEKRRREEEEREEACKEEVIEGVQVVSPEERERLIKGLKTAWEEQNRQYKLLPLVVDSTPMIKKKRNLELSLERIEKNIDLLERNKFIYVTDIQ